jgi:hypothetical protein
MAKMDWMTPAEKLALLDAAKGDSEEAVVDFILFYRAFVENGDPGALLQAIHRRCILDGKPPYGWLMLALGAR